MPARIIREKLAPASPTPLPRRLAGRAWLSWTLCGFVAVGGTALWGRTQQDRSLERASAIARGTATTAGRLLAANLEGVDLPLRLALASGTVGEARGRDPLDLAASSHPAIQRIEVVDAQGVPRLAWNRPGRDPEPATGSAGALSAYRSDPSLLRYVGEPLHSGPDRQAAVELGLREAGASLIAVARLDLRSIGTALDGLELPAGASVALVRAGGLVLLGLGPNPVGFATEADPNVTSVQRWLPGLPLAVVARVPRDTWLARLTHDLLGQPLPYAALVTLLLTALLITRRNRRRRELEADARRKSALLEATLENMDQGLMMFDAETRVQVCNSRAIQLLNLPRELMASKPRFDEVTRLQFATGEFQRTDQDVQNWIAYTGFERTLHSYERERPDGTVLEIRTVPISDGGAVRTYTDITDRKQVEKRIAHMARHDGLTGLANRLLLRERLEAALAQVQRDGSSLAVLCLDLDHFKTVNDTLGHSIGDQLLSQVAKRVEAETRETDTVARLGGDEFAILMRGADQPQSAGALSERLVEILGTPFVIEGQHIHVGVSIGLSIAPTDGVDPDQLMKNADLALYRAKADGRGRYRAFAPFMAEEIERRRALEMDLREAIARNELTLHFQPVLDLANRAVTGFEALVRWRHPTRGMVSPMEFIPIAEETGLIVSLGQWVLREACRTAAGWPGRVTVAVNVSAVQFRNSDVHTTVAATLLATGLAPERLELEVTETVLMGDTDGCLRSLHLLRELGVKIAMDDFGTGYSSLSYLRSYPFDKLKIDRSFIKELGKAPDCAAIVRTIAQLAASLGMKTTAEGVETELQLGLVQAAGCDAVQGYLVSRPVPAEDAARLVRVMPRAVAA